MTMKELAELAGVSSSAVSRYLNGGSLSQDKRDSIRDAIEATGYQPNQAAQMLRRKSGGYVGLIIPKLDSDAVTRVTRGVSTTLAKEGYLSLLADTANDPDQEIAYLKMFQNDQIVGIIFMATVLTPQHEELMKNSSVPIVAVGQRFPQIPCVYHDDFGAAGAVARLILEKGRKKIGYIGVSDTDAAVGLNRRHGVEAAVREYGLDPASIVYATSDFTLDGGRAAMEEILAHDPDIDGLVCATDRIAFGAMEVLRKAGRKIPDEISVAGLDDNWAGEHIDPHLTTAHFYYKSCGETAANMLLDMISRKNEGKSDGPVRQTMLGYTVVERESV